MSNCDIRDDDDDDGSENLAANVFLLCKMFAECIVYLSCSGGLVLLVTVSSVYIGLG